MTKTARRRRLLVGCAAAGFVAMLGVSGPVATAEPAPPMPSAEPIPACAATLREYFAAKGVRLEPQEAADFTALSITLPVPSGWTRVPDPNVPDAFVVIADRTSGALYPPNAQLVVYRLVGDFDPRDAITHGYLNSQQLPAWRGGAASVADFGGFPSSLITGVYRQNDLTLRTVQRHVIATAGVDRYLVSLTVTTEAGRSIRTSPAVNAVVGGFRVATPTAAPGTPTPANTGLPDASI